MNVPVHYFDNATTSWPKHPSLSEALAHYYDEPSGAYARSTDSATLQRVAAIEDARDSLSERLGGVDARHVVMNSGATESFNTIIKGFTYKGPTVWISAMEHNSVMRPLKHLARIRNLNIRIMPSLPDGSVDVDKLRSEARPGTALAIVNAVSNVNGVTQPLQEMASILNDELSIPLLLDASQYLGYYTALPAEVAAKCAFVVFSGHKGLLGPSGTGGFYVRNPELLEPLIIGGNGIHSELVDEYPTTMPDKFLAGTPNMLGLYALSQVLQTPVSWQLGSSHFSHLLAELKAMDKWRVYAAKDANMQAPIFSLQHESIPNDHLSALLREQYHILFRDGLHCAAMAHQHLGTMPMGTIRFSFSPYHTEEDLHYLLRALKDVS